MAEEWRAYLRCEMAGARAEVEGLARRDDRRRCLAVLPAEFEADMIRK